MGVRGLTSYIARNAEMYLQPFELCDCNLVIDGDNLACNLYKDVSGCNSAFGGDYDEYYRTVVSFFHLLSECNVQPFVLLDGGYEFKKMKKVEQRLRSKIALVKHLDPVNSRPIFPLMMREVFVDAARDCGVKIMRCIFEADDEIAVLARKLNCPVLSYDSDFYIHNVKYIPMVTLTMKVLIKKGVSTEEKRLTRCEGKNLKKRKKINNGVKLHCKNECASRQDSGFIKYIDCCIYSVENLTSGCKLEKDMLPIFAVLLGNDYIEASVFKQFFSQVCMKGTNKKISKQQRRIVTILRWLKHETRESALDKILSRMKKDQRRSLLLQIECATSGYSKEKSYSFDYFGLGEDDKDSEPSIGFSDDSEAEQSEFGESEENSGEIYEEDNGSATCYETSIEDLGKESVNGSDENLSEDESEMYLPVHTESEKGGLFNIQNEFPDWLRERIYNAQLPRFCVDLKYQSLYINNPQIENFLYPDCNEVALSILQFNFLLLHYPVRPVLRYLTRQVRVTNVQYKRITVEPWPSFEFDPTATDAGPFREIFHSLGLHGDLFKSLEILPGHLRLYFLAIIYWAKASKHSDAIHFHSLVICLVVLNTIDSKIVPIRDEKEFYKRYKKFIIRENAWRAALNNSQDVEKCTKELLRRRKIEATLEELHPCERIKYVSKIDCIMAQESILKYFQQPQFNRKQHTEFSSSIIHGFSEFQAVVLQMFTLNALCNHPFEAVKMAQMYSGVFLYNIYTSLRDRTDMTYYVKNFILRESSAMFEFYVFLVKWCKPFVGFLNGEDKKTKKTKKQKSQQIERSS